MRFAQSAKLIQNKIKMNFKNSEVANQSYLSEQNAMLNNIINSLKQELCVTQ